MIKALRGDETNLGVRGRTDVFPYLPFFSYNDNIFKKLLKYICQSPRYSVESRMKTRECKLDFCLRASKLEDTNLLLI